MTGHLFAIPTAFYTDHTERGLEAPRVIRRTARHYYIDPSDPHLAELLDDAEHYAHAYGPDAGIGLRSSAKATAAAIRKAMK